MSSRVIPIKAATKTVPLVGEIRRDETHWIDSRGRPLRDVRISITDRCNFRCRYCMPKEKFEKDHCFLSHTEVLSFEEIIRLAKIFAANGIEKIRLTGGEPLLRKGIEFLIEELSKLKTWNGKPLDVAVTTNGAALSAKAKSLAAAGLKRLTVSLDAMDSRIRLSVDGKLYKCLFATEGFDIRQMLRGGASDEEIEDAIGRIWTTRDEHYSEIRTEETVKARAGKRIEMSYIGG